ncbi:restriction endonuclease [Cyanobium sp. Morenito 9A2]|uniref:restriction endonuclease n=1 Tax=Cyanobium sp. Morenito 9A2 TaxID=2823718 RepID=UPI0020CFE2FA|nr:restriction endonuclease [Cyanobium sp. Morenito 9A2]MCP9851233.1 restriction endonuclease [Cyanobium sp. Morenito 9A2]
MNADYRGVSPFTNYLPPDLFQGFVGRGMELDSLRSTFLAGVRGIQVVGPAGSGKTSLARVFADQSKEQFPGGVSAANASWAESPDALFRRVLPDVVGPGPRLLVVDDAEALDELGIHQLQVALQRDPQLRLLLTSRRPLPLSADFKQLALGGLSRTEFEELLRLRNAFAHGRFDEQLVEQLFHVAGGNALLADLAVAAVRQGVVGSWTELFDHLRTFRVPGILGPDGRPIDSQSEEYRKVVIDVTAANDEVLRLLQKEPGLAWRLPPRKFEEIVAEILYRQGYQIELTPASGDGGFDIYAARQDGLGKFLYLVECKRYVPPNKVGVEIVRSLYGVIQTQRATAGAIVTTSFFTAGAQEFQRQVQHQLHLHDYLVLQRWIKDFPITRMEAT